MYAKTDFSYKQETFEVEYVCKPRYSSINTIIIVCMQLLLFFSHKPLFHRVFLGENVTVNFINAQYYIIKQKSKKERTFTNAWIA